MREPKLSPATLAEFYPDGLQKDLAAFNNNLAAVNSGRAKLIEEADELRESAVSATLKDAEKLPAEVAKLKARALALDVAELLLIRRKAEFQTPVIAARSAEKTRLAELAKKRVATINKGLDKIGSETRYRPAIINGDSKVLEYKQMQGAVSGFLKVVTEADEARLAVLQARLAAAVPSFGKPPPRGPGRMREVIVNG